MTRQFQIPGQSWKFRCGHVCILPERYESNKFAYWRTTSPGYFAWSCARCQAKRLLKRRRGEGPKGLLGRMEDLCLSAHHHAIKRGHLSPSITAEKMVEMWNQQEGRCVACTAPIDLLEAAFDHNHDTGEARGFIHRACNIAEGCIAKMSKHNFLCFVEYCRQ